MSFKAGDILVIWPSLLLMTFAVVIVKWLSVYLICKFRGLHAKSAFLVSLSLIPVSEFGIILAQSGIKDGILVQNNLSLLVGLVFTSVFIGVPLLANSHTVYYRTVPEILKKIPRIFKSTGGQMPNEGYPIKDHAVICGYGRVGKYIGRALEMAGIPYLVIDYNHTVVAQLKKKGITVIYGDPADFSVLDYAQVDFAKIMVIAIPDRHTQELIISNAQKLSRHLKIICRTHHEEDQKLLKSLGVATVIQPEFEAAISISERLLNEFNVPDAEISGKISRLKIEHGLG
jgi:CPA2 family monovalent cation:H+ antiporter-2